MGWKARTIVLATVLLLAAGAGASIAAAGDALHEADLAIRAADFPMQEKHELQVRAREAVEAGVPAEDVRVIVSGAVERKMGSAMLLRLLEQADATGRSGLPVDPVTNIIQQGIAKGVPAERIITAVERVTAHLTTAEALVRSVEQGGVRAGSAAIRMQAIQRAAGALQRGMSEADAATLGGTASEKKASLAQFGRAVEAAATLAELGMPQERALTMARHGLILGYTEQGYARMERQLMEYRRGGMSGEDSFREMNKVMERAMRDGGGPSMPGSGRGIGPASGSNGSMRMNRK